jgi:hypothetical protein
MQWTGALLLARHFQITSIEFEVFRFRPSESSMLGAALQFCACAAQIYQNHSLDTQAPCDIHWNLAYRTQHQHGPPNRTDDCIPSD